MTYNKTTIQELVDDCNSNPDLTDWEIAFVESIEFKLANDELVTEKQEAKLEEIVGKY